MGYDPHATWEITKSPLPQITTRLEQMIEARQVAYDARRTAEASWERRTHQQRFQKGEQVWLEGRNIHTSHPTAKLAPKRYGPFPITEVLGPVTYKLRLPEQWNIHPVFHVDLLTPYKETVLRSTSAANRNGTHLVRRVDDRSSGLSEVCIRSVPT